jgi:predicted Na+-dependent transporter
MGIGASIFLIAVGAIITFAVNVAVSGVDLSTIGVILMVVGIIGLLWSLIVAATAGRDVESRRTVVDEPVPPRRTVIRDY